MTYQKLCLVYTSEYCFLLVCSMAHQFNILEELNKASAYNTQSYNIDINIYRSYIQALISDALVNNTVSFTRLGSPVNNAGVLTNDLYASILRATDHSLTAFFGSKQNFFIFSQKQSLTGSKKPRKTLDVKINKTNQPNFSILALFIKDSFDQMFVNKTFDLATLHTAMNIEV